MKFLGNISDPKDLITKEWLEKNQDRLAIETRTYSGLYYTSNAYFSFLRLIPDDINCMWHVKYRMKVSALGNATYRGEYLVEFYGYGSTMTAQYIWNSCYNYPIYYHGRAYPKDGKNNTAAVNCLKYGHYFGVYIDSNNNGNSASYARTVEVSLIDFEGCSVEYLDKCYLPSENLTAKVNGTDETFKITDVCTYTTHNATTSGLQESSDSDTTTQNYLNNSLFTLSERFSRYALVGIDGDNKLHPISVYTNGSTLYSTTMATKAGGYRIYSKKGFDLNKGFFYCASSGNYNPDTNQVLTLYYNIAGIDFRYSDNCLAASSANSLGLECNKAVYLRGTIGNDGLFYVAPIDVTYNNSVYQRAWTQDLPTEEDGYVYVLLGYPYYSSTYVHSEYRLNLVFDNRAFWYKDGAFRPYSPVTKNIVKGILDIKDWALGGTKPSYTLDEVTDGVTRKLSDYLLSSSIASWAKSSTKPSYTLDEVADGTTRKLSNYSLTSHTHSSITTIGDQRSVATTPNDYSNKIVFSGLKNKEQVGSPSNDTYSYVVGLRGWSNPSGGKAHEFAFNNTGIYHRLEATSTTWGSWKKVLVDGDISSWAKASTKPSYTLDEVADGTTRKLSNYATIAQLTNGSVTKIGTATVGAANRPIYLASGVPTQVTSVGEAFLSWGGQSLNGDISPIDAACCDEFGHNKLAFLPADCITVEYSEDGGVTWVDYGLTDSQKIALVTTTGTGIVIGKGKATVTNGLLTASNCGNYLARVTISTRNSGGTQKIYTSARKLLLNVSTNGASGVSVKVETLTIANYNTSTDTWSVYGNYPVSGWSGWNSIALPITFGGSTTQTTQIAKFRITLSISGVSATSASNAQLIDIRLIGVTNWATPSELARAGHLYSVSTSQDAVFPANISAGSVYPRTNNTYTSGTSSSRWSTMYSVNLNLTGTITATGLEAGSSDLVDNSEILTSYASANGFADTNAPGKVYRRPAVKMYNYIKSKLDSVYLGKNATAASAATVTVGAGGADVEREVVGHNESSLYGTTGVTINWAKKSLTASKFIVTGGTSSQVLLADGTTVSKSLTIAGLSVALGGSITKTMLASVFTGTDAVAQAVLANEAVKFQTPRTIWGNTFDGSANINGNLQLKGAAIKIVESLTGTSGSGEARGINAYSSRNTTDYQASIGFLWQKTASNTTAEATLANIYLGIGSTPWSSKSLRITASAVNLDLPFSSTSSFTGTQFKVTGGKNTQFLKADGSLDSVAYLPLTGGELSGALKVNANVAITGLNSLKIGNATLAWDNVHNCLVVDKSFASLEQLSALGASSDGTDGSGSGNSNNVYCTQEEYDALVEAGTVIPYVDYHIYEDV